MGEPLTRAVGVARQAGDTVQLVGEVIDTSSEGTVLLQYPTVDHQVGVIAAVHSSPECHVGQLDVKYLPGGAGTGTDFGTILLRNRSASWCELVGPATITGLSAGHPVTDTVRVSVADGLELSPHAVAAMPGRAFPADQLAMLVSLSAEYRDDKDGNLCTPHWIIPTTWRIVLGSNTLTLANSGTTADARPLRASGLITCRGQFGAAPMRVATS